MCCHIWPTKKKLFSPLCKNYISLEPPRLSNKHKKDLQNKTTWQINSQKIMRGNFQPALFIWNFDPLSICYKQNAPSPRLSCRVVGSQKYKKPSKTQAPSTLPETPHRWEWMLIYIVYIIYIYIIYIIYIYISYTLYIYISYTLYIYIPKKLVQWGRDDTPLDFRGTPV